MESLKLCPECGGFCKFVWTEKEYYIGKVVCTKCKYETADGHASVVRSSHGEIEHDCTDEITCPYCGYEFSESWEYGRDHGEIECHECDKSFTYSRDIQVTYATSRMEGDEVEE